LRESLRNSDHIEELSEQPSRSRGDDRRVVLAERQIAAHESLNEWREDSEAEACAGEVDDRRTFPADAWIAATAGMSATMNRIMRSTREGVMPTPTMMRRSC
jgi:hypothetical protein